MYILYHLYKLCAVQSSFLATVSNEKCFDFLQKSYT